MSRLLTRDEWMSELRKIVETATPDVSSLDPPVKVASDARPARPFEIRGPQGWVQLGEQEAKVFCLCGAGLANHEIAKKTFRSEKTISTHLDRVRRKFEIANVQQLRVFAAIWTERNRRAAQFRIEFAENGGYDSMTSAITIRDVQGRTLAVLDGREYGQRNCESLTIAQRAAMDRAAVLLTGVHDG